MSTPDSLLLPHNVILDELGSTNDYARKLGDQGAAHGSWISTRVQTAGRGRLGRQWSSASGNLFLSVLLRPEKSFPMTWIPLIAALAVYRVAKRSQPTFELVLKWPNDLGIRDRKIGFRKVGGVLCEGVGSSRGVFVVAGIGVNCAIAPETDQPTAALGIAVDPFRKAVIQELLQIYAEPFEVLREEYAETSLLASGDTIEWRDLRGGDEIFSGIFVGYGQNGELQVKRRNEVERLYSEEIKLVPGKKSKV